MPGHCPWGRLVLPLLCGLKKVQVGSPQFSLHPVLLVLEALLQSGEGGLVGSEKGPVPHPCQLLDHLAPPSGGLT